jgi:hypothetical protein
MIKKCIIVIVLLASLHPTLFACEVCGTSAGNMGIGLLSDYRSNFVRLTYFHSRFESVTEKGFPISDRFNQYDLSLRYSLGKQKRLRLMASLPFAVNYREKETQTIRTRGLSDGRLTANYVLLNNIALGKKTSCYLEAGGGLLLPVGQFNEDIHDEDLPLHFNPGRDALAFVWQMNTVFTRGKSGLVFSQYYQWNQDSKSGYHFGNQFNTQGTAFREINVKKLKLIPNAGLGFERTSTDSYANKKEVVETGGTATFFYSGLQIKTEKWLAGFSYHKPLSEKYAAEDVTSKGRISCQLSYIF